jgi:hypothetical protein
MGQNFISCDRGQSFLLPPSLTDWLAEDHLVWTVLGAVELSFTEREKIAVLLAGGAGVRGSRVCSVVRRRRSPESCNAMPRSDVAALNIEPRPPRGMLSVALNVPSRRSSLSTPICGSRLVRSSKAGI